MSKYIERRYVVHTKYNITIIKYKFDTSVKYPLVKISLEQIRIKI